jgi:hypothetical protein
MRRKTTIGLTVIVVIAVAGIGIAASDHTPGPQPVEPHPALGTPDAHGDRPGVVDAQDVNTTVQSGEEVGDGSP